MKVHGLKFVGFFLLPVGMCIDAYVMMIDSYVLCVSTHLEQLKTEENAGNV